MQNGSKALNDLFEKGIIKFSDFKQSKPIEELLQDPFFRDDLRPITNVFKSYLPQYRLAAALAGYEIYVSEFAISDLGYINTKSVLIMTERNKDQDEASDNQYMYNLKMVSKYEECMVSSGIPKEKLYLPPYYGCLEDLYNDYVGKVNEEPFFEYVQELINEVQEPNRSNAQKIFDEILKTKNYNQIQENINKNQEEQEIDK